MGKTRKLDIFGDKKYSKAEIERARDYMRNTYLFIEIDDYKKDFPDSKAKQRMTREEFLAEIKVNPKVYDYLINKESIDFEDCVYANPDLVKVTKDKDFSSYDALDNGCKISDLPVIDDDIIYYCLFKDIKFEDYDLRRRRLKGKRMSHMQKVLYCSRFGKHKTFKFDKDSKYLKLISLSRAEQPCASEYNLLDKILMYGNTDIFGEDYEFIKLDELQRFNLADDTLLKSALCSMSYFFTYTGNVVLPKFVTAALTPSSVKLDSNDDLVSAILAVRGCNKSIENEIYTAIMNVHDNPEYSKVYNNPESILQKENITKVDEYLAVYAKPEIAIDLCGGIKDDELMVFAYYMKPELITNRKTTQLLKLIACIQDVNIYKEILADLPMGLRYFLASIHYDYILDNYDRFTEEEVAIAVLSDSSLKYKIELDDLDVLEDRRVGRFCTLLYYLNYPSDFDELIKNHSIDETELPIEVKTLQALDDEISWISFIDRIHEIENK